MCRDWLCGLGNNGICYFVADPYKVGGFARDLADGDWDALDQLHDELIASPTSRAAASKLGVSIVSAGEQATRFDKQIGAQRFREMKERYEAPKARATRKVTLFRTDDAATAADKVRQLGDAFVVALRDSLK